MTQGFFPVEGVSPDTQTEMEKLKEAKELEFRTALLGGISAIEHQLCLLNARFEETFETQIEGIDV